MQPPSWLAAWQPDQTPLATVDQIAADVDRLDAALAPTGPEALLVLSDRTLSLFPMPDNWEDQAQAWYAALADIPEDLIRVAFERVASNCRFWPRPAEVREQISVELMERRVAARRLKVALAKAKREVADEERRLRQGAAMNAPPVSDRHPITVRVNKITKANIVTTREKLAAGRNPKTANKIVQGLVNVLKYCEEREQLADIPRPKRLKQPESPRRRLL